MSNRDTFNPPPEKGEMRSVQMQRNIKPAVLACPKCHTWFTVHRDLNQDPILCPDCKGGVKGVLQIVTDGGFFG
jgi:hypothetical protein